MSEEIKPITPTEAEASRRFEQHRELAKQELTDEMRVARAEDHIRQGKWSRITGKDPSGAYPYSQEKADGMVERAESTKESAQADLELSHQASQAQVEQSAQWKAQNLDKLIGDAKAEDEARSNADSGTKAA